MRAALDFPRGGPWYGLHSVGLLVAEVDSNASGSANRILNTVVHTANASGHHLLAERGELRVKVVLHILNVSLHLFGGPIIALHGGLP